MFMILHVFQFEQDYNKGRDGISWRGLNDLHVSAKLTHYSLFSFLFIIDSDKLNFFLIS